LEYSWDGDVLWSRDQEKLETLVELMTPIQVEEEYTDQPDITRVNADEYFIMGTPEECAEEIQAPIDVGISKFMCWFVEFPKTHGMELFADKVVPQFR